MLIPSMLIIYGTELLGFWGNTQPLRLIYILTSGAFPRIPVILGTQDTEEVEVKVKFRINIVTEGKLCKSVVHDMAYEHAVQTT